MTTDLEKVWEIPEPLSVHQVRVDDETVIALRRHGNPAGPRLVMSHGNGLAIDLYYPFWSLLADDFELMLYDLRNHGWNRVGSLHNHTFVSFVQDHDAIVEAIEGRYGKKPTVGVYHSVSGLATLLSSAAGDAYAGLALFDPTLYQPEDGHEEFEAALKRAAAITRSRTERFTTLSQFTDVLPIAPAFRRMVPGVWELMARTTLREDESGGGYVLRCPREYEAQVSDYARAFAALVDFDAIGCPIKVIGADPTLPFSYLPSFQPGELVDVDYDFLPETTHFLQLEKPEECVAELRRFLRSIGFE